MTYGDCLGTMFLMFLTVLRIGLEFFVAKHFCMLTINDELHLFHEDLLNK